MLSAPHCSSLLLSASRLGGSLEDRQLASYTPDEDAGYHQYAQTSHNYGSMSKSTPSVTESCSCRKYDTF